MPNLDKDKTQAAPNTSHVLLLSVLMWSLNFLHMSIIRLYDKFKLLLIYYYYYFPAFQVPSTIQSKASAAKPMRLKRDIGPLLPFEELVHEIEVSENESCKEDEESKSITLEDCALPDPCALLHVTNRRKVPPRTKSLPLVCTISITFCHTEP